jgi:CHASE3 domain sensor protein
MRIRERMSIRLLFTLGFTSVVVLFTGVVVLFVTQHRVAAQAPDSG